MHGRVLTNVERARRKLTSDICCVFCAGSMEDCNHLFRQCEEATVIWKAFLRPQVLAVLNSLSWENWLVANITGDRSLGLDVNWPEKFANRLWWMWRWRNELIFNGRRTSLDQKLHWLRLKDVEISASFHKQRNPGDRIGDFVDTTLSWTPPQLGWMKLNVDGSCSMDTAGAGCGGVLRGWDGKWKRGFTYTIGRCTIQEVEAWGVLQGLCLASCLGVQYLVVESDCKTTIDQLRRLENTREHLPNIIQRCVHESRKFSRVVFNHVFREQNRLADALAKLALRGQCGLHIYDSTPPALQDAVLDDQRGVGFKRRVRRVDVNFH